MCKVFPCYGENIISQELSQHLPHHWPTPRILLWLPCFLWRKVCTTKAFPLAVSYAAAVLNRVSQFLHSVTSVFKFTMNMFAYLLVSVVVNSHQSPGEGADKLCASPWYNLTLQGVSHVPDGVANRTGILHWLPPHKHCQLCVMVWSAEPEAHTLCLNGRELYPPCATFSFSSLAP